MLGGAREENLRGMEILKSFKNLINKMSNYCFYKKKTL